MKKRNDFNEREIERERESVCVYVCVALKGAYYREEGSVRHCVGNNKV